MLVQTGLEIGIGFQPLIKGLRKALHVFRSPARFQGFSHLRQPLKVLLMLGQNGPKILRQCHPE